MQCCNYESRARSQLPINKAVNLEILPRKLLRSRNPRERESSYFRMGGASHRDIVYIEPKREKNNWNKTTPQIEIQPIISSPSIQNSSPKRNGSPESALVSEGGLQLGRHPFKTKNKHYFNMHRPSLYGPQESTMTGAASMAVFKKRHTHNGSKSPPKIINFDQFERFARSEIPS